MFFTVHVRKGSSSLNYFVTNTKVSLVNKIMEIAKMQNFCHTLPVHLYFLAVHVDAWGWGSIMVSISVCPVGLPGSSMAQSVCFRKVEFYQHVFTSADDWFTKGHPFITMSM